MEKWKYEIWFNDELVEEGETDEAPLDMAYRECYNYLDVEEIRFDTDRKTGSALLCGYHGVGCCDWGWGVEEDDFETFCEGTCTWAYYYIKDKKTGDELSFGFEIIEEDNEKV